jgi:hypothetical protein
MRYGEVFKEQEEKTAGRNGRHCGKSYFAEVVGGEMFMTAY